MTSPQASATGGKPTRREAIKTSVERVSSMGEKVNAGSTNTGPDRVGVAAPGARILLVNNVPDHLASCDALFYILSRFGTVERVKILRRQHSTALVQMATPPMAEKAFREQERINERTGTRIVLGFSTNVKEVKLPSQAGLAEDGLSKDFTSEPSGGGGTQFQPLPQWQGDDQFQSGSTCCLLVSNLPGILLDCDSLCNLFGVYGDVQRVKILRNKPDCALVQFSKPHQALQCKKFLDHLQICGMQVCVSLSRMKSINLPSDGGLPDDDFTRDYSTVRGAHRFGRTNETAAMKLAKNACSPTTRLHIGNLPSDFSVDNVKAYFLDAGLSTKEVVECGKAGSRQVLVTMQSVTEAVHALVKLHNTVPSGYKTPNGSGVCISFSNQKDRSS